MLLKRSRENQALYKSHSYYLLSIRPETVPIISDRLYDDAKLHINFLTNPRNAPFFENDEFCDTLCDFYWELAEVREDRDNALVLELQWRDIIEKIDLFKEYSDLVNDTYTEHQYFYQMFLKHWSELTSFTPTYANFDYLAYDFKHSMRAITLAGDDLSTQKQQLLRSYKYFLAAARREIPRKITASDRSALLAYCDIHSQYAQTVVDLSLTMGSILDNFNPPEDTLEMDDASYIWDCQYVLRHSEDPILNLETFSRAHISI